MSERISKDKFVVTAWRDLCQSVAELSYGARMACRASPLTAVDEVPGSATSHLLSAGQANGWFVRPERPLRPQPASLWMNPRRLSVTSPSYGLLDVMVGAEWVPDGLLRGVQFRSSAVAALENLEPWPPAKFRQDAKRLAAVEAGALYGSFTHRSSHGRSALPAGHATDHRWHRDRG
jgi:hypothetical protein